MGASALVLDFYDDTDHSLMAKMAAPTKLANVPLEILNDEQRRRLPDSDFGLICITKRAHIQRRFPVNDPGNAWLSAQYFNQTHDKLAFPARFIAARFIKQACDAYGVPTATYVEKYASMVSPGEAEHNTFVEGSESGWMLRKLAERELLTKEAAAVELDALVNMPNEHYALVVHTGDGSVIRKYAMPDAAHVKMAAEYFDKYAMKLAPEHRHRFASSVKNRARELDVDLGDSHLLDKWASQNWNQHVLAHLEQRKSLLPRNPGARDVLDKLAASLRETTPEDAAQALATFDQATQLDRYYDRGLADPYSSVMAKSASGWSSDEIDGHVLTEDDLKKVASSPKLKQYLGSDLADSFSKQAVAIFESLPLPEKVLIKQIATGEV